MTIYVDLDGTLAEYASGDYVPGRIGKPIQAMLKRLEQWIGEGKTVKIFTARAYDPIECAAIRFWLRDLGLPVLEITNVKGFDGVEFWDDRAITVEMNTGRVLTQGRE